MASLKNLLTTYRDIGLGRTSIKDAWNAAKKNKSGIISSPSVMKNDDKTLKTLQEQESKIPYANPEVKGASTSKSSGGVSGSSSVKSGEANEIAKKLLKEDNSDDIKENLEKQKEREAEILKEREKAFTNRYAELGTMIEGRRAGAEETKASAMESVNAELQNLLTKADVARTDTKSYYQDEKDNLQKTHTDAEKEMARIFGSRNILDSSYYVEKMQEGDTEFEKTLAKLGTAEASQYSKLDADMTLYSKQAISKKAEIEKAYNETIRAINEDLTKNGWEKEDALQNLESEFNEKMATIDDRIITAQTQQQQFRTSVMQWAYDKSFEEVKWNDTYKIDAAKTNATLQKQESGDTIYDALSKSAGGDGKVDPDVYARLRSSAKISADQFDKKYGFMLSGDEQKSLGVSVGKAQTSTQIQSEIWQDLASPEAADMTDEEKAQYIKSRGGDPADFGIYY